MSSNGPNGGPMNERAVGRDNREGEASPSTPKAPPLSSLQEWEAMFHAIPCGVLLMDIKGNILAVNGHTETLFDYSSKELIGQPVTMLMPERYQIISKTYLKQFSSTLISSQLREGPDCWGLSRNGKEFRVKVRLNVLQIGEDLMAMVLLIPVSTQRMMEESIGYGILEHSNDHVAVVDHQYCYEYVNSVYEKVHGLSRSEILGKRVVDLLGLSTYEKIVKSHLDQCFTGERVVYQYRFYFKDKGFRKMEVTYLPVRAFQHGPVDRIIVHSRDITEVARLEHSILAIQEVLNGESRALESSREKELVQNLSPVGSGSFPSNLAKLEQLTPQKRAILAHVAQGKTNKEIAGLLNISDKTVRNHLTAIFRKLRITRRPEAVSLFIRADFENVGQNQ